MGDSGSPFNIVANHDGPFVLIPLAKAYTSDSCASGANVDTQRQAHCEPCGCVATSRAGGGSSITVPDDSVAQLLLADGHRPKRASG
jgi:hypothetical protein